jgi:hypothetical protein
MAMFKTLRARRVADLTLLGFAPWEAAVLSKQPKSVWTNAPYFKQMASARSAEYTRWLKAGKSEKAWQTHILIRYNMKNYTGKYGAKKRSPTAVYNMVEVWKKDFKGKNPDYKSPKELKKRDYTHHDDAMAKFREKHTSNSRSKEERRHARFVPYKNAN